MLAGIRIHSRRTLTLAAIATVTLAATAAAQELRSDERVRQQERKPLAANVSTTGERVFEWLERYLTSSNRWYVTIGNLMPSSGFAPGLGYQGLIGETAHFNVRGAWSIRNYSLAEATLSKPLAGDRMEIGAHARWRDGKTLPFYGIGDDTRKEHRGTYALRNADAGITASLSPTRWFRLSADATVASFEEAAGGPGQPVSPDYIHISGSAAVDSRESPGYTRSGGYYALTFHQYGERGDGRSSFRQIEADLRQFLPVLNEHWVIALRGYATTVDEEAGDQVPFYLLPSLGGSSTLRAYPDGRFRDRNAILLSAEYRWIPGRLLDMALFVDAGKVEARRQDLDLRNLRTSVGIGARFHAPAATALRVDVARGHEGLRLHFAFGKSF